jgi:hypothetical protein
MNNRNLSIILRLAVLLASMTLLNGPLAHAQGSTPVPDPTTARVVLWSTGFESGNISHWYWPSTGPYESYGGGEYDSGFASSAVSEQFAHSGISSLKMTIMTPSTPTSGTRMFRWLESRTYSQLYYRAWYYLPEHYSVTNWWNIFQWKSRNSATGAVDPFFTLNVGNRPDGTMYLYLFNWQTRASYQQALKNIPIGKWFKVEAFYRCAGDATGRVTFWQDGVQLFDVPSAKTRYANGDCEWSVDNYSEAVNPTPTTIYVDDVAITTPVSCDLNSDGVINVADVQLAINQALGRAPCTTADVNQDGLCNTVDVQRIINAASGGMCRLGP